jgi:hypothetical protein
MSYLSFWNTLVNFNIIKKTETNLNHVGLYLYAQPIKQKNTIHWYDTDYVVMKTEVNLNNFGLYLYS